MKDILDESFNTEYLTSLLVNAFLKKSTHVYYIYMCSTIMWLYRTDNIQQSDFCGTWCMYHTTKNL